MNDRVKLGVDCFRDGYNCCQSVLVAFADLIELPKETLLSLGVALGGGFARTRNLCGAVNAMGIVYGLIKKGDKTKAYAEMQAPIEEFKAIYQSVNCGEILKGVPVSKGVVPEERTPKYYAVRPCEKIVEDSIKIIEKYI